MTISVAILAQYVILTQAQLQTERHKHLMGSSVSPLFVLLCFASALGSLGLHISDSSRISGVYNDDDCFEEEEIFEYPRPQHPPDRSRCVTHLKWVEETWDGKVMMIYKGGGNFGNQMFYAARALTVAAEKNRPVLVVKSRLHDSLAALPCLQSSPGLEAVLARTICRKWSESELLELNGIETSGCLAELEARNLTERVTDGGYQQDLTLWGNNPERGFPMLRAAFNVQSILARRSKPGPNDLVIHFRPFMGYKGESILVKGSKLIGFAPFEFYKRAVERHRATSVGQNGQVLLICDHCWTHPTAKRLVHELNATVLKTPDNEEAPWLYDFALLSAAKNMAIGPSTFAWWAAAVGKPNKVYYPIMPGALPVPWCKIMPPNGHAYIFDDWWTGHVYDGNMKEAGRAREVCNAYLPAWKSRRDTQELQDALHRFYPEIENVYGYADRCS